MQQGNSAGQLKSGVSNMLARESGASSMQQRNPGHQPPRLEPPEARLHPASRLSLSGGGIYELHHLHFVVLSLNCTEWHDRLQFPPRGWRPPMARPPLAWRPPMARPPMTRPPQPRESVLTFPGKKSLRDILDSRAVDPHK